MIILNTTTKSLELVLAGAITTNQLAFVASYVDISQTNWGLTGANSNSGASNSTTPVTVAAAPAADTSRQIKFLSVFNADTVAAAVTLQVNDNATVRQICTFTLAAGDTLVYVDGDGFAVFDGAGSKLVSLSIDHNSLTGLQGGTTGEYYHLTNAELTKLNGIEDGATADQTAAEIKAAYESNPDTNAFTDANVTKLAGIETGADVTDAENVGAAINGSSEKTTPADSDKFGILDSAASFVLKWLSWSNLKAAMLTHIASAVATFTNKTLTSPTINGGNLSGTFTGSPTFSGTPVFRTLVSENASGSAEVRITQTDAAVDNKVWRWVASSETLRYIAGSDSLGISTNYMTVDRTGTTVDTVSFPNGGVVVGSATGGSQGNGTVNAVGVYDDGVLLTDYVFDAEIDGDIDTVKWDAAVPNRIHVIQRAEKARTEKRVVTRKQEVQEIVFENGRHVLKKVLRDVPIRDKVPVFDESGNKIGETEIDRTEEIAIPAKEEITEVEVRTHEPARRFKVNLDELDPAAYAAKWKADRKLPAFVRGPSKKSTGEAIQALIETCEAQAVHIDKLLQRIAALEAGAAGPTRNP